ncbi:caspase domain-containing protein [Achaetomium macrosporum]|uniref:Caspase domain-containing protein n=1 Tax=Achaetomium macrosporum TaxID=79813 RepID=A0AAN7H3V4_9PEZI|nr:caspase domain-containing protein [Achaetomium macrosporum]
MTPTKWALLCGGDHYFEGTARNRDGKTLKFPNLGGCVQDVNGMYNFLISTGMRPSNIARLTATCGEGRPVEDEEFWPTHQNIVRELNRITDIATPGDLVYIHYSGHGIRRDATPPNPDGDSMMGMALVMTDVLRGGAYLTGYQLGSFIRKMVQKDLRVTLVLDSCYSGRAIRGPENTPEITPEVTPRTVPHQYDDTLLESDAEADAAVDRIDIASGLRDTESVRKDWLSNPTGCTILTACGPHEVAGERRFGDSTSKHGVLSYCILSLLREWRGNTLPSHARMIQHAKIQIRRIPVRQSPRILGDGNYEFFGASTYVERPSCHVTAIRVSEIDLDVGSVQGVAVGALYDIFPRGFDSNLDEGDLRLQAKVASVSLFQSTAVLLPGSSIANDGREWFAVLRQWALPNTSRVKFVTTDQTLHNKLKAKLEMYPGLELIEGVTNDVAFTVKVDRERTYEILQDGHRLPRLPRISVSDDSGVDKLAYTLSHVSRFLALRKLVEEPPRHLQLEKFRFEIKSDLSSAPNTSNADISVQDGDTLDVSLTYDGPLPVVYASLFCFKASWGISKLDPSLDEGQVSHPAIPGIPISELEMTMEVPDKSRADDPTDITDVFVVFVSAAEHVSWDEICLDSLPVDGTIGKLLISAERGNLEHRDGKVVKKKSGELGWTVLERVVHTSP